MEGRFLLIPVDLRSLQLLLKCLSGFTIFTLYLNFLYFDTKCGFQFLNYSVFIYLFLLSIRCFICFQKTTLCQSYSMQHQCYTHLDTLTTKKETQPLLLLYHWCCWRWLAEEHMTKQCSTIGVWPSMHDTTFLIETNWHERNRLSEYVKRSIVHYKSSSPKRSICCFLFKFPS